MPANVATKILELRQLLAERFGPGASRAEEALYATGFPVVDEIGLPRGALTEIVTEGPGGSLLLYGLLHAVLGRGDRAILIDGRTSFGPKGLPQAELNRLLWVRCHEAWQAVKAADLAVRDGNVPLVLMLLTLNPAGELRRIPATAWHRLQMLAEKSGVALLVFTPRPQIGCARLRVTAGGAFPLSRLHVAREELVANLNVQVQRRRLGRSDGEASPTPASTAEWAGTKTSEGSRHRPDAGAAAAAESARKREGTTPLAFFAPESADPSSSRAPTLSHFSNPRDDEKLRRAACA